MKKQTVRYARKNGSYALRKGTLANGDKYTVERNEKNKT